MTPTHDPGDRRMEAVPAGAPAAAQRRLGGIERRGAAIASARHQVGSRRSRSRFFFSFTPLVRAVLPLGACGVPERMPCVSPIPRAAKCTRVVVVRFSYRPRFVPCFRGDGMQALPLSFFPPASFFCSPFLQPFFCSRSFSMAGKCPKHTRHVAMLVATACWGC